MLNNEGFRTYVDFFFLVNLKCINIQGMPENKTQPNNNSVTLFLNSIENEEKRKDAQALLALFKGITNEPAIKWGESIIGFGTYHYKYDSGREGDMPMTGFSPRKLNFSIYIMSVFSGQQQLMQQLGLHKSSKAYLYIKRLKDIEIDVLSELIKSSYLHYKNKNQE